MSKPTEETAGGPRVLVVKLSSLGDLFHALPAVHRIKAALGARVDWVTQREYVELVRCFGVVDRVIAFPRRGTIRQLPAFLRELRLERYEHVLDFQGLLKSALIGRLARSGDRLGPSFYREGAHVFYSRSAGVRNKNRHAVEENQELADALGAPAGAVDYPLNFPEFNTAAALPRVACVPVSRWASKNWPVSRFVETLQRLQAERGVSVYLLGGALDRYLCAGMAAQLKGTVFNLAGRMSLPEMGGVLKAMNLVLANDTGPIHLAAALGVPVLAVYGPTDAVRTGPYGPSHQVVTAAGLACRPCLCRTCRKKVDIPECLAAVTPDEVVARALHMLG